MDAAALSIAQAVSRPGVTMTAVQADVKEPEDHERIARAAVDSFGQLDYWINNAGVFPAAEVLEISLERLRQTLDVNVGSVLKGSQAAARHMVAGGAIVNVSSLAAHRPRRTRAEYCASKAAVSQLTENLALELGDLGIRVNSIAPGYVDTAMTKWIPGRSRAACRRAGSNSAASFRIRPGNRVSRAVPPFRRRPLRHGVRDRGRRRFPPRVIRGRTRVPWTEGADSSG
jgi:3-oxoacyl-[acyl-carrier protein] reductase